MGCIFSGCEKEQQPAPEEPEAPKQYSWDKRPKIDPQNYTIKDLKGETAGRLPGQVKGIQFIIQDCEDSNIFIFDHINTVTIDECTNCRIFLGPIQTSVFIRDCQNCKIMVACQQFRTRQCRKMDVFLHCSSQPIIESTTGLKLACFQYYYPELEDQFHEAGISMFNNNWSNIHDFTPVPGENNFSLLPEDVKYDYFIPSPAADLFASMQVSLEEERSVVPKTMGSRRKPSDESCLVVFFNDGASEMRAKKLIDTLRGSQSGCVLVQTKELTMQPADAQRVFGTDVYQTAVQQGPVIGLEYNGDGCIQQCQEAVLGISKGATGVTFVSQNLEQAKQQIDNFYNYADMQMAV